jgi:D-glycero-D-manno-heptose 1,7-bisphosphate phosphatase
MGLMHSGAAEDPPPRTRPGVIVDRDGVLNEDLSFVGTPERLRPIAGAGAALARLHLAGAVVAVVTNQSGVARGFFDEASVDATNAQLARLLSREGDPPDAFYFCPHHPEGTVDAYRMACACRKPGTLLVERAIAELGLDRGRTVLVGHTESDIACGRAAALATVAVGPESGGLAADHRAADLGDAVDWIVGRIAAIG